MEDERAEYAGYVRAKKVRGHLPVALASGSLSK